MSTTQRPYEEPTLFDHVPIPGATSEASGAQGRRVPEAKRSIRYMVDAVLTHGKVSGFDNLLDRVAAFRQYRPFNALLIVLQRPGATHVLPAHAWLERYGRVVKPEQQPLVMLQPGGPLMFLFDVSQTEAGPDARPLPEWMRDPFAIGPAVGAADALHWLIFNAKYDGVRVTEAAFGYSLGGCAVTAQPGPVQRVELSRRPQRDVDVAVQYEALLNASHTVTEKVMVLAHELGHIYCGHLGPCRSQLWPTESFWRNRRGLAEELEEIEANSVARLVMRRLDPAGELPRQLSPGLGRDVPIDAVDLEQVLTAAGRVIEMTEGPAPRRVRSRPRPASR